MKFILIVLLFSSWIQKVYATPSRLVDSTVDFSQRNEITGQYESFSPLDFEINLSTCIPYQGEDGKWLVKFENHSDWLSCQTRRGLKRKIRQLRQQFDSLSDFTAAERRDLRQRLDWLISYYQTLPSE